MSFFTTNDLVNINFHDYGSSMNPPIILIGGYSSSEVTWFAQIEAFVNAGYRVITYDHRSHGDSQKVDYGLTLHRLAMDLKELKAVVIFYIWKKLKSLTKRSLIFFIKYKKTDSVSFFVDRQ